MHIQINPANEKSNRVKNTNHKQVINENVTVKYTWIILAIAWTLFLTPIPGTSYIGIALNFGAIVLIITNLVKGNVQIGIIQLICAMIISPIFYIAGATLFMQAASKAIIHAKNKHPEKYTPYTINKDAVIKYNVKPYKITPKYPAREPKQEETEGYVYKWTDKNGVVHYSNTTHPINNPTLSITKEKKE